jgi:hypothetical protein
MNFLRRAAWVLTIWAVTALILTAMEPSPPASAEKQKVERKS